MSACSALAIGCSWLAAAAASPTTSDAWLDSDQLRQYCLSAEDVSEPADGMVCVAYVQGFIAGASVPGDQRGGAAASAAEAESLSERAIRTRAASYVRRVEDSQARSYCLGDDVTASAVLQALIEHLEAIPDDSAVTAKSIVHETLIQRFPCPE